MRQRVGKQAGGRAEAKVGREWGKKGGGRASGA